MEKENKKNNYLSPQLTVVEFKEERGYGNSSIMPEQHFFLGLESESYDGGSRTLESRENGGYWGSEGTWF